MIDLDDTIVACSSPPGVGAISLVRVSSPDISFLAEYFSLDEFKANEAKVTEIELKKGLKEKCVLTLFRKPNSFTGEDILEVSCHGNPLIANLLVSYFVSKGCREAEPGEFSLRSFMNNKLTILEAEAIDDLINAETEEQLLASSRSLKGAFDSRIDFVIEKLKDLRIYVESNIDFSDDEIINDFDEFRSNLDDFIIFFDEFIEEVGTSKYLNEGVKVVLTGPPNVGKSTLMNYLAGKKTSIVSEIPGTTRDIIQKEAKINNLKFSLFDTAGIRDSSQDPIEIEGIDLANEIIQHCDLVIEIVDENTKKYFKSYNKPVIRILNKIDVSDYRDKDRLNLSFFDKKDLTKLNNELFKALKIPSNLNNMSFSARSRHINLLHKARREIFESLKFKKDSELELIAENLKRASDFIGEIKAPYTSDQLLGEIFSSFCIGK